jgi:hypothetical protein
MKKPKKTKRVEWWVAVNNDKNRGWKESVPFTSRKQLDAAWPEINNVTILRVKRTIIEEVV